MKRILPPLLFLACIVAMGLLNWLAPLASVAPGWVRVPALALVIAGIGLSMTGARLFAKIGTNIKTFDEPGRLVTGGPYRYTRNPMYLGFAAALLGIALLLGSLSAFIVWIAFVVVTDRWYIAFEERVMHEKFGDAYRAYQQRTRRWI